MSQFMRSRKVTPRRKKSWYREYLYLIVGAGVMVAIMLWIVATQDALVDRGYKLTQLRNETVELEENNRRLRAELASLTRPDRVWQESRRMGLIPMDETSRFQVHLMPEKDHQETLLASKEP